MQEIKNVKDAVGVQARLLDIRKPDWFSMVDTETLDQRLADHCVLAQTYGEYMDGINELFGNWDHASRKGELLGFKGGSAHHWTAAEETQAWINEINDRRNKLSHAAQLLDIKSSTARFVIRGQSFIVDIPAGAKLTINDNGYSIELGN